MSKTTVDTDWVTTQYEKAGTDEATQRVVNDLLDTWEDRDIDPKKIHHILHTFTELAKKHALLPEESDEVWVECVPGFVHTGDIVRVRHDAFEAELGHYHNGRRGRVLAVRYGDIVFRSEDGVKPHIEGAHYKPADLERLVR